MNRLCSAIFLIDMLVVSSNVAGRPSAVPPADDAAAMTQVIVIGTYHFDNPGLDLSNVEADDVLKPKRQRELASLAQALSGFDPTLVAVEWPADKADRDYAAYRKDELPESRNEVVQLGFRLAALENHERVYGIDAPGDFPFEPVQRWAEKHGKSEALAAIMQSVQAMVSRVGEQQRTATIGAVLRDFNSPAAIERASSFYANLLRFGAGDEQPGAELNAAWARRNFVICAKLLQALRPGDRAVVFYGQGHVYALQRCVIDAPDVELIAATPYLR